MVESAKEKTSAEKLEELKLETGNAFFLSGKLQYEIEVNEQKSEELRAKLHNAKVNIHNLCERAEKLQSSIQKEAMEIKMAPPLAAPNDERPGER